MHSSKTVAVAATRYQYWGVSVQEVSVQWGSLSRRESVYKGGFPYPLPVDRQTPVKTLPSLAVGQNVERLMYISIT